MGCRTSPTPPPIPMGLFLTSLTLVFPMLRRIRTTSRPSWTNARALWEGTPRSRSSDIMTAQALPHRIRYAATECPAPGIGRPQREPHTPWKDGAASRPPTWPASTSPSRPATSSSSQASTPNPTDPDGGPRRLGSQQRLRKVKHADREAVRTLSVVVHDFMYHAPAPTDVWRTGADIHMIFKGVLPRQRPFRWAGENDL